MTAGADKVLTATVKWKKEPLTTKSMEGILTIEKGVAHILNDRI